METACVYVVYISIISMHIQQFAPIHFQHRQQPSVILDEVLRVAIPNHDHAYVYVLYLTSNATNAEMTRGWVEWVGGGGGRCSRPTLHPLLAVVARSTTDPHQLLTAPLPGAQMTAFPTFGGAKKKLGSSSSNHGHLNIEKQFCGRAPPYKL